MERRPLSRTVGLIIAKKRKELGLSQEELAERVGISQESLSRMEKGAIAPKFERLQAFADAFNCQVADLFAAKEYTHSERVRNLMETLNGLSPDALEAVTDIVKRIASLMPQK